jgi:phytoene synthase
VSTDVELADAYDHCEAVTRAQAANFYYGIRLLPGERRRSMCAVYAFARRVDDIGDGTLVADEKLRLLDAQANALAEIGLGGSSAASADPAVGAPDEPRRQPDAPASDPVMVALADTQRRFPLPAGVLGELIEGVRMDVAGTSYDDFDELVVYCRRVAGAIGRVCLAIFGVRAGDAAGDAQAERLADELGVALQLTNILRDVREDAENGRVYLPGAELRRFAVLGVDERPSQGEAAAQLLAFLASAAAADAGEGSQAAERRERRERLEALVRFECERARQWFDRGITLTDVLDRRSAACVLAMAGIYRRLLERIEASPDEVARRRVSLPAHEKAWVAARGMLGVGA